MFTNNKILIVDDNPSIHQDFNIALEFRSQNQTESLTKLEVEIFGKSKIQKKNSLQFDLKHAFSTEEALSILKKSIESGEPIAIIFMDIKMPTGMDGVSASKLILENYPQTEIVFCSAFSEYTHEEILSKFGFTDHIIILKKPFDIIEVRQLAIALIQKWNLNRELEKYTLNLENEVKKRTKDLEDALTLVKKSDMAKSNFLSLMSHEIRNPINTIVGLIDLIQKCQDLNEKENYIQLTQKSSQTLLELVNDVLDLSKIEAHQLVLESNLINLPLILEQLVSNFSLPILKNGRELVSIYPIHLPEKVYGDSSRIKQILTNFLTNASKFTPEGSISIHLEYKRINSKKASFIFKIIDTGIGISEKDQKKLFTDYSQISDGIPYNLAGTGLGLSITRKLAALMDGDVGVQSKKGRGSTFWLETQLDVSKNDICVIDKGNIPKNLGLLIITQSDTTKFFFNYYAKELEMEKNTSIFSDINEIGLLLNFKTQTFEVLHVFFDFELNLSDKNISALKHISKNNLHLHSMVPILFNSKKFIDQNQCHTINFPLNFMEVYQAIAPTCNFEASTEETYSDILDTDLQEKIKQCKILLVDDDPMALLITSTNLKNFGFVVDQAESSEIAIEYHKKFKFDLIFMDLMLNGSNGIETTQKIRALPPPFNNTYIVALTANAFIEDKKRCLEGGMNDFLTKPLSPNSLYEVVMNFILNKFENNLISAKETLLLPLNQSEIIYSQIDDYLNKTYGFKKDQILKILQISKTSLIATLNEIDVALLQNNQKLLGILFHRIKGSLKNIGLNEPSEWAQTVELEIIEKNNLSNAAAVLVKLRNFLAPFLT